MSPPGSPGREPAGRWGIDRDRSGGGVSGVHSWTFPLPLPISLSFSVSLPLCLCLFLCLLLACVSAISVSVCGTLSLPLLLSDFRTFVTPFVAQCHRLSFSFSRSPSVSARLGSRLHLPAPSPPGGELRALPTLAQAPLGLRQPQVLSRHLRLLSRQPGPPLRPEGVPSGAAAPGGLGPAWN